MLGIVSVEVVELVERDNVSTIEKNVVGFFLKDRILLD